MREIRQLLSVTRRSLRIYRQPIVINLTVACRFEVGSTLDMQASVTVYVYLLSGVVAANPTVDHLENMLQNPSTVRTRNRSHRHT